MDLNKCESVHSYNTRSESSRNLLIPEMNTSKGQTAFVYLGAQVWNSLPLHIREAQSISLFPEY